MARCAWKRRRAVLHLSSLRARASRSIAIRCPTVDRRPLRDVDEHLVTLVVVHFDVQRLLVRAGLPGIKKGDGAVEVTRRFAIDEAVSKLQNGPRERQE